MYLITYDENIIDASIATYLVGFSSFIIVLTSTITRQRFFPSERLIEFDLIGENEYEIGFFILTLFLLLYPRRGHLIKPY